MPMQNVIKFFEREGFVGYVVRWAHFLKVGSKQKAVGNSVAYCLLPIAYFSVFKISSIPDLVCSPVFMFLKASNPLFTSSDPITIEYGTNFLLA